MEFLSDKDINIKRHRRNFIKAVVGIVIVSTTVVIPVYKLNTIAKRGEGNKYNCETCKKQGYSCDIHLKYNAEEALCNKIENYGMGYTPSMSDIKSKMLMYGHEYNTACDFCIQGGTECYSCEYDRKAIDTVMSNLVTDEIFKSRLNNTDWEIGYPDSYEGRLYLIQETKNIIHNKDNDD